MNITIFSDKQRNNNVYQGTTVHISKSKTKDPVDAMHAYGGSVSTAPLMRNLSTR